MTTLGSGILTGDPIAIAIDSSDNIFTIDRGNHRVVEFSQASAAPEPSSIFLCIAGAGLLAFARRRRA